MKKLVLTILSIFFYLNSFAQKTPTYVIKRAQMASEFISAEMSFDELKMNDLYDILLDKYDSNRKSIKGKNLSKEEKQIIYRKSFMETKQKLSEKFTDKEVNMINKLHREWQKNNRK